jgi:hypothetical protein
MGPAVLAALVHLLLLFAGMGCGDMSTSAASVLLPCCMLGLILLAAVHAVLCCVVCCAGTLTCS